MAALDDKIHRIASEQIDEKLQPITAKAFETAETVKAISTKVDAIYGNGSGRVGILDEIKAEQKNMRLLQEVNEKKNSSFRHEVRNYIDQQNLLDITKEKYHDANVRKAKSWKSDIKWILTGASIIVWEFIKEHYFKR